MVFILLNYLNVQRRVYQLLSFMIVAIIMASCASTNDVVSDRRIQKRKYNKGFFFDFDKKWGKSGQEIDAIALDNNEDVQKKVQNEVEASTLAETASTEVKEEAIIPVQNVEKVASSFEKSMASDNEILSDSDAKEVNGLQREGAGGLKAPVKELHQIKSKRPASSSSNQGSDVPLVLLIILAFLIPFLAVGLYTDWDLTKTLIALLLTILFYLPGLIYALLVIFDVV